MQLQTKELSAADYGIIMPPSADEIINVVDINEELPDVEPFNLYFDRRGFAWAKCTDLKLDPDNAREHTAVSVESIRKSLRYSGQQHPIVVQRSTRLVPSGNGRLLAARAEGWEYLRVTPTDLTGLELKAYALNDNRTGESSGWQWSQVSDQAKEMVEAGFDLNSMLTFEPYEIEPLLRAEWKPKQDEPEEAEQPAAAEPKHNTAKEPIKSTRVLIELQGETLTKFQWALETLQEGNKDITQPQAFEIILNDWLAQGASYKESIAQD